MAYGLKASSCDPLSHVLIYTLHESEQTIGLHIQRELHKGLSFSSEGGPKYTKGS